MCFTVSHLLFKRFHETSADQVKCPYVQFSCIKFTLCWWKKIKKEAASGVVQKSLPIPKLAGLYWLRQIAFRLVFYMLSKPLSDQLRPADRG